MRTHVHNETVTVMVPTYNEESYIDASLDSLRRQTHERLDIIVCDDHSTDETFDRAREHARADDRVTVLRPFSENKGACALLNYMLGRSKTRYVARHDGDDVSMTTRMEEQLHFMAEHERAVLCSAKAHTMIGARTTLSPWEQDLINPVASDTEPVNDHLKTGPRVMGGVMFGVQQAMLATGGFEPEAFPLEDWDQSLKLARIGEIFVLNRLLYRRRLHGNNSSQASSRRETAYQHLQKTHDGLSPDIPIWKIRPDMNTDT